MKIGITLITLLFAFVTVVRAQSVSGKDGVYKAYKGNGGAVMKVERSKDVNGAESTSKFRRANNETILQEMYSIEDERFRIENNESLSVSERASQIAKNKNRYNSKKTDFIDHVLSVGVLNVSQKEQKYYLSLLKNDNKIEECKRVIELIKTSK